MSDAMVNLVTSLVTIIASSVCSLSLINWRLSSLEKKVEIHNGYAEKFAATSTDIALMKQDIKYIKDNLRG